MLWAVAPTLTGSFFILIAFVPFAGAQSPSSQVVAEETAASLRRLEVGGTGFGHTHRVYWSTELLLAFPWIRGWRITEPESAFCCGCELQ
jgi:hypothetical protein